MSTMLQERISELSPTNISSLNSLFRESRFLWHTLTTREALVTPGDFLTRVIVAMITRDEIPAWDFPNVNPEDLGYKLKPDTYDESAPLNEFFTI